MSAAVGIDAGVEAMEGGAHPFLTAHFLTPPLLRIQPSTQSVSAVAVRCYENAAVRPSLPASSVREVSPAGPYRRLCIQCV